jgi:hypothetical protein
MGPCEKIGDNYGDVHIEEGHRTTGSNGLCRTSVVAALLGDGSRARGRRGMFARARAVAALAATTTIKDGRQTREMMVGSTSCGWE